MGDSNENGRFDAFKDMTITGAGYVKMYCHLLLFFFLLIYGSLIMAQTPEFLIANSTGGINSGITSLAISTDNENSIYTAGYFYGEIDFDPGPGTYFIEAQGNWPHSDIFVSKLDSLGNFLWARAIGGTESDWAYSMMVDPLTGEAYITGQFMGIGDFNPGPGVYQLVSNGLYDVFVTKLTSEGNFVWARSIGGSDYDNGKAIKFYSDRGSGICLTGYFGGTVDFDPGANTFLLSSLGEADVFICKWDTSGLFVWAKSIGGTAFESPADLSIDRVTGAIYTIGNFRVPVDFDPGPGVFTIDTVGTNDMFICKLNENGNFLWASAIGGAESNTGGTSIVIDSIQRDVYICGSFTQSVDFDPGPDSFVIDPIGYSPGFICRLNSFGQLIWAKAFQGYDGNSAFCWAIAVDPLTGDVFTTGSFDMMVDFDPGPDTYYLSSSDYENNDVFFTKVDHDGNFVWAYATGGPNNDFGWALTLNKDRIPHLTGLFHSDELFFDPFIIVGPSFWTSFVAVAAASPLPCVPIVSSLADSGSGSLREILGCAQTGDTIVFQLPPMSQITLTSGELKVNKNFTISGSGMFDLTISGNNSSRIINLMAGRNLTIENLSLKNGSDISNGGAILTKGYLTLQHVLLENNFENGLPKGLTLISPGELTIQGMVDFKY